MLDCRVAQPEHIQSTLSAGKWTIAQISAVPWNLLGELSVFRSARRRRRYCRVCAKPHESFLKQEKCSWPISPARYRFLFTPSHIFSWQGLPRHLQPAGPAHLVPDFLLAIRVLGEALFPRSKLMSACVVGFIWRPPRRRREHKGKLSFRVGPSIEPARHSKVQSGLDAAAARHLK
jgi:hypothetical protein